MRNGNKINVLKKSTNEVRKKKGVKCMHVSREEITCIKQIALQARVECVI